MNKGFLGYFKELAAKAKTTANSEEALSIRNKLIKIGIILVVIGGVGLAVTFLLPIIMMVTSMKGSFNDFMSNPGGMNESVNGIFDSFIGSAVVTLFSIPFFICVGVGCFSLYLGFGIVVAKATVNFADPNKYCPHCGDVIYDDEKFCSKCGKPLLINKICKKCNTENDIDSNFCKSCGNKLD